jgi:type II secretory pathway pseudopilin PulG
MKKSFSLIELTVAIGILVVGILGVISSYIGGAALTDTTKNIALTSNAAAAKFEYMRRETLGSLDDYNNNIFPAGEEEDIEYQNLNYRGIIYVDSIHSQLKQVTIVMCWQQGERTIGEDWVFEDDANPADHPIPDSPVTITTLMAER